MIETTITSVPGELGALWLASGGSYTDPDTGRQFQADIHTKGWTDWLAERGRWSNNFRGTFSVIKEPGGSVPNAPKDWDGWLKAYPFAPTRARMEYEFAVGMGRYIGSAGHVPAIYFGGFDASFLSQVSANDLIRLSTIAWAVALPWRNPIIIDAAGSDNDKVYALASFWRDQYGIQVGPEPRPYRGTDWTGDVGLYSYTTIQHNRQIMSKPDLQRLFSALDDGNWFGSGLPVLGCEDTSEPGLPEVAARMLEGWKVAVNCKGGTWQGWNAAEIIAELQTGLAGGGST